MIRAREEQFNRVFTFYYNQIYYCNFDIIFNVFLIREILCV